LGALDAGDGSVPHAAARGVSHTCAWDLQVWAAADQRQVASTAVACGGGVREEEGVESGTRILRVSCLLIWFAAGLCTSWVVVVYWAGSF
jgi:hypothetical protein